MNLRTYLKQNELSQRAFGASIGRSEATVSRLVRGIDRPSWPTLEAIMRATGGQVSANDFAQTEAA
jgi:transcriptional regulator with XRE-family HTH domain